MNKRPLTNRERWLLALLPAGLIAIVSFFIPNGSKEREMLERQIAAAPSGDELHRELSGLISQRNELKQLLNELETAQAATHEEIASLREPIGMAVVGDAPPIAQRFKHVMDFLQQQQITLIKSELVREMTAQDTPPYQVWALTLVGSWPQMQAALADESLVPEGVQIDSLSLESASQRSSLRQWRMIVSAQLGPEPSKAGWF